MKTAREDHKLMDLLKINEISRIICDTNMGTLKLRIRKGEREYRFVLDSVELDKDTNKEVFELLYPPITKDVYVEKIEIKGNTTFDADSLKVVSLKDVSTVKPKLRGRPKGSKNVK